jgi:hypothetical protein
LQKGITEQNEQIMDQAFTQGVDINARLDTNELPLNYAIFAQSLKGVLWLLKKGVRVIDPFKAKLRVTLVKHEKNKIVEIPRGGFVRVTPIILAAQLWNKKDQKNKEVKNNYNQSIYEIFSHMIKGGANIEDRDSDFGMTPLMHAAYNGNYEVAQQLIQLGAHVNAISNPKIEGENLSVLECATYSGSKELVDLILKNGGGVEEKLKKDTLPYFEIAEREYTDGAYNEFRIKEKLSRRRFTRKLLLGEEYLKSSELGLCVTWLSEEKFYEIKKTKWWEIMKTFVKYPHFSVDNFTKLSKNGKERLKFEASKEL